MCLGAWNSVLMEEMLEAERERLRQRKLDAWNRSTKPKAVKGDSAHLFYLVA